MIDVKKRITKHQLKYY